MSDALNRKLNTILVVDDNPLVRNGVVAVLKHAKYRVLSADGAEAAIHIAETTEGPIDRKRLSNGIYSRAVADVELGR